MQNSRFLSRLALLLLAAAVTLSLAAHAGRTRAQESNTVYLPLALAPVPVPAVDPISRSSGANSWTVSWTDGGAAVASYTVQQAGDPDFSEDVQQFNTADTFYNFSYAPSTDNRYYYRVRANGPWGAGPWSDFQAVLGDFFDDFSDPGSGWEEYDLPDRFAAYLDDAYVIRAREATPQQVILAISTAPDAARSSYCAAVDVRWNDGSPTDGLYGIVFGANDAFTQYYFLAVFPQTRQYRLFYFDSNRPQQDRLEPLTAPQATPDIQPGTQSNRLEVRRVGQQIAVLINGEVQRTLQDDRRTGLTYTGLLVAANPASGAAEARFDNFALGYCDQVGATAAAPRLEATAVTPRSQQVGAAVPATSLWPGAEY